MKRESVGYQKGTLRSAVAMSDDQLDAFAVAMSDDQLDALYDSDEYDYEKVPPRETAVFAGRTVAWLPHSCDEWIIGDAESIRALIADLQAVLQDTALEGL